MRTVALAAALALVSAPAFAQVTSRSDEALREDGWTFSDERSTPGSPVAAVIAITAGSAWHGVGHWVMGDRGAARRLVIAQAAAVAAIGLGLALRHAVDESPAARTVGASLAVAGGGALAAGWMADVIGAFKGTGDRLPENTEAREGASVEAAFVTLGAPGVRAANFAHVALPVVARHWRVEPWGQLSLSADHWRAGLVAAWRIPFGPRSDSFVELGAVGMEEQVPGSGFGKSQVAGMLALALDVGDLLPHLGGLSWTTRLDVAADYFFFDATGNEHFRTRDLRVHVPVETGVSLNVDPTVHIGFGYRHRRDALVGMAGRNVGSFSAKLGVLPWRRFGVEVELEQGAFTSVHIGFGWRFASLGTDGAR